MEYRQFISESARKARKEGRQFSLSEAAMQWKSMKGGGLLDVFKKRRTTSPILARTYGNGSPIRKASPGYFSSDNWIQYNLETIQKKIREKSAELDALRREEVSAQQKVDEFNARIDNHKISPVTSATLGAYSRLSNIYKKPEEKYTRDLTGLFPSNPVPTSLLAEPVRAAGDAVDQNARNVARLFGGKKRRH